MSSQNPIGEGGYGGAGGAGGDGALRREARRRLAESGTSVDISWMATADVQALLEELRTWQAELQIQNEELRAARDELAVARDRYRDLFERAPLGYLILDGDGSIREANATAAWLLGQDRDTLLGRGLGAFIAPSSQDEWFHHRRALRPGAGRLSAELELLAPQGPGEPPRVVRIETLPEEGGGQEGARFRSALMEVTLRRQAERDRDQLMEILEAAPMLISWAATDGRVGYINRGGRKWLGLPAGVEDEREIRDSVRAHRIADYHPEWARRLIERHAMPVAREQGCWEGESALLDAAGHEVPVSQLIVAHRDRWGEVARYSTVVQDLSREKALERELAEQAFFDRLTGVANRRHFEHLLEQERQRVNRYAEPLSVVFLDVDGFKALNEAYGREIGDEVLQELVRRLQACLREPDAIGRWSGEAFLVMLPQTRLAQAQQVAEALRGQITEACFPGTRGVTVSLGVTQHRPGERLQALLRRADDALRSAKREGGNRVAAQH